MEFTTIKWLAPDRPSTNGKAKHFVKTLKVNMMANQNNLQTALCQFIEALFLTAFYYTKDTSFHDV